MDNINDRKSHVLVFDDNDVDRFAVCLALNQSGFAGGVHDTGSAPQAIEQIETTTLDCVYIGDSTARTHLFSVLLALNRVGYRGRIVIVAYGLELTAAHGAGVTIDLRGIARLTPEQFAEDCRQQ
jgi:CheY-like chemotaxis protein